MSLLRICMAALIAAICMQQGLGQAAKEGISYRLLDLDRRQFGDESSANYSISVDRFLDHPQVEQLICRVLRDTKPYPFSMLSFAIYYNLEEMYVPNLESGKFRAHIIASYLWSTSLPDKRDRLGVWRDPQGSFLDHPQLYDFDHTKACRQDDGKVGK